MHRSNNLLTMNIAIYTLTSELHDEQAVGAVTKEFLDSLDVTYELKGNDYADSMLRGQVYDI